MFEAFQDFCLQHYLWIKAFHIISIVAWMAGLLYLPRLFVYHAGAASGSELSETLKVMERRLLRLIMNPAMIAAYVFGLMLLAAQPGFLQQGWMHVKLACVLLLTGLHHADVRLMKKFARDANTRSVRFFRIFNEIPALLLIIIVIMVVVKPFSS
jgi:putative membrane protein